MKDSDVEKSEEEEYITSSEDEFEEKSEDDYGKEESDEEWKEGSGGIYIYFHYQIKTKYTIILPIDEIEINLVIYQMESNKFFFIKN